LRAIRQHLPKTCFIRTLEKTINWIGTQAQPSTEHYCLSTHSSARIPTRHGGITLHIPTFLDTPLSANVGTNFADKRWSDYRHGVSYGFLNYAVSSSSCPQITSNGRMDWWKACGVNRYMMSATTQDKGGLNLLETKRFLNTI
jgi:hypothetical protein